MLKKGPFKYFHSQNRHSFSLFTFTASITIEWSCSLTSLVLKYERKAGMQKRPDSFRGFLRPGVLLAALHRLPPVLTARKNNEHLPSALFVPVIRRHSLCIIIFNPCNNLIVLILPFLEWRKLIALTKSQGNKMTKLKVCWSNFSSFLCLCPYNII